MISPTLRFRRALFEPGRASRLSLSSLHTPYRSVRTLRSMEESFTNFLGGSPLNRLSWLRTSTTFLNAIADAPSTRYLIFRGGNPLVSTSTQPVLARLPYETVSSWLGSTPIFGQGQHDGSSATTDGENEALPTLEASRFRGAPLVFLGLQEPAGTTGAAALPSSDFSAKSSDASTIASRVEGTPFFALDVTTLEQDAVDSVIQTLGTETEFGEPRTAMARMDQFEAALFAEARTMVDWNSRNKFCPSCGSPVYSLWAGWKISCSSLLPWADNTGRAPCPSAKGLHNFTHPRTDAVVIMLAIDEKEDKVLLGRGKKFPPKFYSALAGFMEPGEGFEDAVKREMWEEAGVRVHNVRYHSCQPWPYPANVMVGFYASADSSQPLRTDLDNELADVGWYTREQVRAVLAHPKGTTLSRRDNRTLSAAIEGKDNTTRAPTAPNSAGALAHSDPNINPDAVQNQKREGKGEEVKRDEGDELLFMLPPMVAIAGVLVYEWAYGKDALRQLKLGAGNSKM